LSRASVCPTEYQGFSGGSRRAKAFNRRRRPVLESRAQAISSGIKFSFSRRVPDNQGYFTIRTVRQAEQNLNYDTIDLRHSGRRRSRLSDTIAANLSISIEEKQQLLEIFSPIERLNRLCDMLD